MIVMKYVKSFGEINEGYLDHEDNSLGNKLQKTGRKVLNHVLSLEALLRSFFKIFSNPTELKQIWTDKKIEKDLLQKSYDLYHHFIDIKDIIDLPIEHRIRYAKNLGIKVDKDTNILNEISKVLYRNHYNSDLIQDMEESIEYLEKTKKSPVQSQTLNELRNMFLTKIKEIKQVIEK